MFAFALTLAVAVLAPQVALARDDERAARAGVGVLDALLRAFTQQHSPPGALPPHVAQRPSPPRPRVARRPVSARKAPPPQLAHPNRIPAPPNASWRSATTTLDASQRVARRLLARHGYAAAKTTTAIRMLPSGAIRVAAWKTADPGASGEIVILRRTARGVTVVGDRSVGNIASALFASASGPRP